MASAWSERAASSPHRPGVPGGRRQAGSVVQVQQRIRGLGTPARHVEVGQRRRRLLQRDPEGTVGLTDVAERPRPGGVRRPLDGGADLARHEPDPAAECGLAGLERRRVEVRRATQPHRVAGDRQRDPDAVGAGRPELRERPGERHRPLDPGQPGDHVGGVLGEDRIDHQVRDDVPAQPGGTPPREARRDREHGMHGPPPYAPAGAPGLARVGAWSRCSSSPG